ncbi:mechanosensitive ion channel MscS [Sphingomonas sp. MM-1]|uniref:mechanosensitive ion channel family protein n=1 Tax=Sphingomonas sp. MM-1 TaxID=745310 RepID=UPI0002C1407A|nr:mechanosensitive ion channel domain-containing protein [Sphingomonas sp. MM-1]AGH50618.1 mechanosensitive ion channel MscS [Sphingomonas sp. MM-1]
MTTASNSTAPWPAGGEPFDAQIHRLWTDSLAWTTQHGLQIIAAGIGAAIIVLLLVALKRFGLRLCRNHTNRNEWPFIIGQALGKTRLWFMVAVAAQLVATYADAPVYLGRTIAFFFTVASVLQVAVWARVLILGLIAHRAGGAANASSLGSAMGIIRLLVTIAVFAIAAIVILDNLGVNVTGLIAGLGIGGIAIGLAAQGIFQDLFAALSILFDKPFQRGEGISYDTTSGSVEAIGLKSTRIRSATGEEIVISNANLLNKELRNFTRLKRRRMIHRFGVIYQTAPDVLASIPAKVRAIVEAESKTEFLRCGMVGLGASSLDFELQYDIRSTDYEEVFATNHRVLIAILTQFNAEGVDFAYPTQTTFTAAPDGRMVMPYPEPAGHDASPAAT